MTAVDFGNQVVLGSFNTALSGKNFGNVKNALRPGIYSGLVPSRISNTEIQITPGIFEIKDSSADAQVRVATTTNITPWVVSVASPYVVFRYVYADSSPWYAELLNVVAPINDLIIGNLHTNDVVIGLCQFSAGNLVVAPNTFNYNTRTDARYCIIETYPLDGTKNGTNLTFTLPTGFPSIREEQWYLSYNGAMLIKNSSYTVSGNTTSGRTITLTVDAPQVVDDLRAVVISH